MSAACNSLAAGSSQENWSSSSSPGSTEPWSPLPAGPGDKFPMSEHQWVNRAQVETIVQDTAGCPEIQLPREWQRCEANSLDSEEELGDMKCRKSERCQHNHDLRRAALDRRYHSTKDEEPHSFQQQLHTMHRLLRRLQQRVLQMHDASKDGQDDAEEDGYTRSPLDMKPKQSSCQIQTHPDSGFKWRTKRERAGQRQTDPVDRIHLTVSQQQRDLSDVLKYEISRAVSKSVDLVFENFSAALMEQSARLLGGTERKQEEMSSSQEPPVSMDKIASHPYKRVKTLMPTDQTEALPLVKQKPPSLHHSPENQVVKKTCQMPPSLYPCGHEAALDGNRILRHVLKCGAQSDFRSPHNGCPAGNRPPSCSEGIHWHCDKVRSKRSSSTETRPAAVESPCIPHVKTEPGNLQSVMPRNPHMFLSISFHSLTPNHLKKAKLMFFYMRYPSSSVLKSFFPDVKFNRCVTSQLIKWFSNFREFYYIQMEKFARQAVLERTSPQFLSVSRDSELFRALNVHYNKANDFQVPDRFLEVAEITLKQFFSAILLAKDTDPSWKKAIYKVICKLDSDVPHYFKSFVCS
ncbi:prospero homeobox protein 1-like isoform X2 [Arapaima gigas]